MICLRRTRKLQDLVDHAMHVKHQRYAAAADQSEPEFLFLHPGTGRRSVDNFNRHAKHVSGAALGKDVARVRRIGLELVSQPHDLRIDRTVVDVVAVQAGQVEELVARKDAMRRTQENDEEAELAVAEAHHPPAASRQAASVEVQLPTVEAVGADALRPPLVNLGAAAAQHGAYAREQLARTERLG